MGGHGALTMALRLPEPVPVGVGVRADLPIRRQRLGGARSSRYLGEDRSTWAEYDASLLLRERGWPGSLLIDQGTSDPFLDKLRPGAMMAAIAERRQAATFRMQPGYDHSYFFVASFMADHVAFHAEALLA